MVAYLLALCVARAHVDAGVHWVSIVTTVLGPVRSVAAYTRQIQAKNGPGTHMACWLLARVAY
jgi:hypothetical protein